MSRPLGVTILALLQFLNSLVILIPAGLAAFAAIIAGGILGLLLAFFSLILLIIGLIMLLLAYGLWNTKGWAWMWTMIINILSIIFGIFNIAANIISIIISVIIVIYLNSPGIKAHFR